MMSLIVKVFIAQLSPTLCNPMGSLCPWNSPGKNTGVDSCSLFQGIFPTQESNPGLLHRRRILYQLSYQGSLGFTELLLISGNFPDGSVVKNPPTDAGDAGDMGLIPQLEDPSGEGNDNSSILA